MAKRPRSLRLGIAAALLSLLVDQSTKAWALERFTTAPRELVVTDFFNLVLVRNTGVTFGMFSGLPPWALVAAMVAIVIGVFVSMLRVEHRISAVAHGLILGGAMGNIADRIRHAAVTDFLDFHVGSWHWPAFNGADIVIVCGVALLLLEGMVLRSGASGPRGPAASE